jgi:hypothetical protein
MNPIRLPRVAAKMSRFAEVETASHGRAVEIQQTKTAVMMTAADGHQLCRITAPAPAGTVLEPEAPFLVDARDLSKAAAAVGCSRTEKITGEGERPLVVFPIVVDDKPKVGITGPEGSPQLVSVPYGSMPNCTGIIDTIQGEAASGMTRAVARVDPHYMQSLADTAIAMNIPVMEITFAPRWNFLLAEGTAPDGCMIQVAIAGIGDVTIDNATTTPPAAAASAEMTFTMPVAKGRSNAKRKPSNDVLPLSFESDIPF